MASYNKVHLMGNLTRDPQLKYLPSQNSVVEFGIACNRRYKTATGEDRDEATFVEVAAFGKTGELINQYFSKGKPIFIEGRLKYDQWEDKQGGGKRSKLTVVAENIIFLPRGDGGGGGGGNYQGGAPVYDVDAPADEQRAAPPPRQAPPRPPQNRGPAPAPKQPPPEPPFGDEQQFKEDDIPF